LADGRRLIATRVVPAADWIGRATGDRGREGLLVSTGEGPRQIMDPGHG
jgi:hypothetical protein